MKTIHNIHCETCKKPTGSSALINSSARQDEIDRITGGYICEPCNRAMGPPKPLFLIGSSPDEQREAFAKKWSGKIMTSEAFSELFAIMGIK